MNKKELFAFMAAIVDKNVEKFKSDFDFDKAMIDSSEEGFEAIWLVRDLGTQMVWLTNSINPKEYIDSVYSNMRVLHSYHIKYDGEYEITEINRDKEEEILKSLKWYKLDFGIHNYKGVYLSRLDAEKAAEKMKNLYYYSHCHIERSEYE